eukprot:8734016-Alexandrium_andersonii.AAC.1
MRTDVVEHASNAAIFARPVSRIAAHPQRPERVRNASGTRPERVRKAPGTCPERVRNVSGTRPCAEACAQHEQACLGSKPAASILSNHTLSMSVLASTWFTTAGRSWRLALCMCACGGDRPTLMRSDLEGRRIGDG